MRRLALAFFLLCCSHAHAVPLVPVPGGTMAGIPLAQAIGTMRLLGEWQLLSGGQVHLQEVLSHNGGECGVSGLDDANTCGRFVLFVSVNGETSVPTDFVLFRLPETLGWTVPKAVAPKSDYGKFSLPLSACEMKKTAAGTGWKGTSYVLRITEDLKDGPDGNAHYVFAADLEKLPGERVDCAN